MATIVPPKSHASNAKSCPAQIPFDRKCYSLSANPEGAARRNDLIMENLFALGLTTLASAFVGSYVAGYLKKKGENLATHEDIDKLVDQVRAVTTATKEIEERIESSVWSKQRHWEMKRDALFASVQALDRTKAAFIELWASQVFEVGDPEHKEERKRVSAEKWLAEISRYDETRSSTSLVCRIAVRKALGEASQLFRSSAALVFKSKLDNDEFAAARDPIRDAIKKVYELARAELGIVLAEEEAGDVATSHCNGTSASPSPD
jgi:hypothetical protein